MYQGRVWTVADECNGYDLAENAKSQIAPEVTSLSVRRWRRGELPPGLPDLILFDLRHDDALEQAQEWAAHVRGTGLVTVPWIAVTNGGIPLETAIQADQIFAGFTSIPMDANRFERTLRFARKRMLVRG